MRQAVLKLLPEATIVIKTAAVADYSPKQRAAAEDQAQRSACRWSWSRLPTFSRKWRAANEFAIVIGFAAETENVLENARRKLASKSLDAIVVNDVSREGVGIDSDRNAVTIITPQRLIEVPETTKWEVAHRVLDQAVRLRKVPQAR